MLVIYGTGSVHCCGSRQPNFFTKSKPKQIFYPDPSSFFKIFDDTWIKNFIVFIYLRTKI